MCLKNLTLPNFASFESSELQVVEKYFLKRSRVIVTYLLILTYIIYNNTITYCLLY